MMIVTESASKAKTHGYRIFKMASMPNQWHAGVVSTPLGYVWIYAEPKAVTLSIIHNGYDVQRTINGNYSKRGIVTLARRFIEEMQP